MEWKNGDFIISDQKDLLDIDTIYRLLSKSYWAADRKKETISASIQGSLCLGIYTEGKQVGFARVVTDKAVFSWICDVIVDPNYQGQGLGKWLMSCLIEHPEIKMTKMTLATKDAHGLYAQYDFEISECMRRKAPTDG